jgi:hypothetical protein
MVRDFLKVKPSETIELVNMRYLLFCASLFEIVHDVVFSLKPKQSGAGFAASWRDYLAEIDVRKTLYESVVRRAVGSIRSVVPVDHTHYYLPGRIQCSI